MLATILKTVTLIGSDLPAYKALFDEVLKTLSSDDQQAAKDAYEAALDRAAKAHAAAQAL